MWLKFIFRNNETTSVDVLDAWEVRWKSRHGIFSDETIPEVRVFKTKDEAEEFKIALIDAFNLIKNKSEIRSVTIKKTEI